MGLTSALQIGRSALAFAQSALQITGNNVANASTPGFTRQTAIASPQRGNRIGNNAIVGNGVYLSAIQRHVDEAINARLRTALSEENYSSVRRDLLTQIETLQNEMGDAGLSSGLSKFFNAWSQLANNPTDPALRSLVVQQGAALASQITSLRSDYSDIRAQLDRNLGIQVQHADELASAIADLNGRIVQAEQGQATASSLRDQRDQLLDELAGLMPISVVQNDSGAIDVFVGSTPLINGTQSRGITLNTANQAGGGTSVKVEIADDGSDLKINSGTIGSLLSARSDVVDGVIADLDTFASALIQSVNVLHSQGQGLTGFESVTGTNRVLDSTAALNSAAAGLPFEVVNGSVQLHLTHTASGERQTFQIDVDLDGVGTDMSLDDFVAAVNAQAGASGLTASVSLDGKLQFNAASGYELSFSNDTAGILAATGVNTYFTGADATDISINQTLIDNPSHLATGADHITGSNDTALAIADLRDTGLERLSGQSLSENWSASVQSLAALGASAQGQYQSSQIVRESLQAQRAGVSGVSLDEETVNLMQFQTQYQAAARYMGVVQQLTASLLAIV